MFNDPIFPRFWPHPAVLTRSGASESLLSAMQGVCKGIAGRGQTRFAGPIPASRGEGMGS